MWFPIFICLLPIVAYARIDIEIQAAESELNSSVNFLGMSVRDITDNEQEAFKIEEGQRKIGLRSCSLTQPPRNLKAVKTVIKPKSGRILGIQTEPVIVTSQEFINNSSRKGKYNAGISQQIENTVSNTWTKGGEFSIDANFYYKVKLFVASAGGSLDISYNSSWGQESTMTKTVTLGSSSGVEVELDPGQAVVATLSATRGTMEVQVDFSASLTGEVECVTVEGQSVIYNINAILAAAGLPRTVSSSEELKIGFYANARTVLTDKNLSQTLAVAPAAMFF